jgi:hypothetical protein
MNLKSWLIFVLIAGLAGCGEKKKSIDEEGGQTTNGDFAFNKSSIPILNMAQAHLLTELKSISQENLDSWNNSPQKVELEKLISDVSALVKTKYKGKTLEGTNHLGILEPKKFAIEKVGGRKRVVAQPLFFQIYAEKDLSDIKSRYTVARSILHESLHLQRFGENEARDFSIRLLKDLGSGFNCMLFERDSEKLICPNLVKYHNGVPNQNNPSKVSNLNLESNLAPNQKSDTGKKSMEQADHETFELRLVDFANSSSAPKILSPRISFHQKDEIGSWVVLFSDGAEYNSFTVHCDFQVATSFKCKSMDPKEGFALSLGGTAKKGRFNGVELNFENGSGSYRLYFKDGSSGLELDNYSEVFVAEILMSNS